MLVELGVMEQRYRAVLEVLDGAEVTDVARRYGVARQTVLRSGPGVRNDVRHGPFAAARRCGASHARQAAR